MVKKLTPEELVYNIDLTNKRTSKFNAYDKLYDLIEKGLNINDKGYNIYLIDDPNVDVINNIKSYINDVLSRKNSPKDICYVTGKNKNEPESMVINNGYGKKLFECVEEIKKLYKDIIYKFYNGLEVEERDVILEKAQNGKKKIINKIVKEAEEKGFDLKPSDGGFNFVPLKDGEPLTEGEYDNIDEVEREEILKNMKQLKESTKVIFTNLKNIEENEISDLKECLRKYIESETKENKYNFMNCFEGIPEAVVYIYKVFNDIKKMMIENYSSNYEKDSEKIVKILLKYHVNVIVDNSENTKPTVIYEDDPCPSNLFGNIEYVNHDGSYDADVRLIKAGSLLKANDGCLIIRAKDILERPTSYYYLKKVLLSGKIRPNYGREHFEVISLNTLKPKPVDISVKIILVGDYETYNLLYSLDEDFRELFKVRAEYNPVVEINEAIIKYIENEVYKFIKCKRNNNISSAALKEIYKYLSRLAGSKNKLLISPNKLKKILTLCCYNADKNGEKCITDDNIRNVIYKKSIIEEEINENYVEKKILMNFSGSRIGQINGLSVISLGYAELGKPIRITCTCSRGSGNIVDIQKENSLSGSIHSKSISILKGLMNEIFGGYNKIPVDFHVCFEQIYGKLEGDSASVAEIVSILSALSKIPIKQNIAVTGSINQFGEVQPIGGVNEKIEGFYEISRLYNSKSNYAVVIPQNNQDNIILNYDLEKSIIEGDFSVYTMTNIKDAVKILMDTNWEDMLKKSSLEMKKYGASKERNH
ncbi:MULTISPECIES: AAA family ATPase [Clostridium]|uniref:AAA family ATPase n=1 Tax=Clostridium TaxID=1485 RepID=UPI000826915B|nr:MULTISPECIES: AAA family ATPase [Clostridium]PJI09890.1 Lon protease family protein [Clostridium sp. CT7]